MTVLFLALVFHAGHGHWPRGHVRCPVFGTAYNDALCTALNAAVFRGLIRR